ncbi:hypothetical protein [Mangrovimonas sp. TPBH4]|uniref:hypothetical protein n=1 Tax=Mangrovimonas sp. TPBH4 TaxID=1645914 RepID=UPI0006B46124|nr:hypothetical protein [Mangrovimonas sp. TPBH4]
MKIKFLNSLIILADSSEAKSAVSQHDSYIKNLTSFDIQSKVKRLGELSYKDYLANAQLFLYDWKPYEEQYFKSIINQVEKQIKKKKYKFNLPDEILVIKSAMHEEGGLNGFTRENYMVLNLDSLSHHLFEHELFHIISRYNRDKIYKAYSVLGFKPCNEVEIPSTIINFKISNPDAPFNNFYIELEHNKKPIEALMLLYSNRPYSGGKFFSYVNKGLMLLKGDDNSKEAILDGGRPIILDYSEVNGLYEKIGKNTGYNIHQEEVTADHFSMALNDIKNLPDQHLVDKLDEILIK